MENFKSMYPREIRMIQSYVSEACDRMDYQNSPMYDEWPEQRMVDQMCNSVCEAVSTSGDMGILREAWEMQEKKTIERMSVEEEQEEEVVDQEKKGVEKGTDREKEKVETEELNDEENKKNDGKKRLWMRGRGEYKRRAEENKNPMESDMEENIYQVTAEADLREHNRIIESQEMRPPLRNWWNGWGSMGLGRTCREWLGGWDPCMSRLFLWKLKMARCYWDRNSDVRPIFRDQPGRRIPARCVHRIRRRVPARCVHRIRRRVPAQCVHRIHRRVPARCVHRIRRRVPAQCVHRIHRRVPVRYVHPDLVFIQPGFAIL